MRLFAFLALAVIACGATEVPPARHEPPEPVDAQPAPIVDAAPDPGTDASDAGSAPEPNVNAQMLRGELVTTYMAYSDLHEDGPQCKPSGDAGRCTPNEQAQLARDVEKRLRKRLQEAKSFAAEHADAPPEPVACLTALADRVAKLAEALERSRPTAAARTALTAQVQTCDVSLDQSPAALSRSVLPAEGATSLNGRLAPEEIQGTVRRNFGRFKLCYENGLRRDPSLGGSVAMKFVIDTDGSVIEARVQTSTLPDAEVSQCITAWFWRIRFPPPQGGVVTVVYPLIFTPGGLPADAGLPGKSH